MGLSGITRMSTVQKLQLPIDNLFIDRFANRVYNSSSHTALFSLKFHLDSKVPSTVN